MGGGSSKETITAKANPPTPMKKSKEGPMQGPNMGNESSPEKGTPAKSSGSNEDFQTKSGAMAKQKLQQVTSASPAMSIQSSKGNQLLIKKEDPPPPRHQQQIDELESKRKQMLEEQDRRKQEEDKLKQLKMIRQQQKTQENQQKAF